MYPYKSLKFTGKEHTAGGTSQENTPHEENKLNPIVCVPHFVRCLDSKSQRQDCEKGQWVFVCSEHRNSVLQGKQTSEDVQWWWLHGTDSTSLFKIHKTAHFVLRRFCHTLKIIFKNVMVELETQKALLVSDPTIRPTDSQMWLHRRSSGSFKEHHGPIAMPRWTDLIGLEWNPQKCF